MKSLMIICYTLTFFFPRFIFEENEKKGIKVINKKHSFGQVTISINNKTIFSNHVFSEKSISYNGKIDTMIVKFKRFKDTLINNSNFKYFHIWVSKNEIQINGFIVKPLKID